MKRTVKRARIIYNEEFDSFDIEILTNNSWGLESRYNCVASDKNPNPNYIHFGILRKISDLSYMGYKVEVLE